MARKKLNLASEPEEPAAEQQTNQEPVAGEETYYDIYLQAMAGVEVTADGHTWKLPEDTDACRAAAFTAFADAERKAWESEPDQDRQLAIMREAARQQLLATVMEIEPGGDDENPFEHINIAVSTVAALAAASNDPQLAKMGKMYRNASMAVTMSAIAYSMTANITQSGKTLDIDQVKKDLLEAGFKAALRPIRETLCMKADIKRYMEEMSSMSADQKTVATDMVKMYGILIGIGRAFMLQTGDERNNNLSWICASGVMAKIYMTANTAATNIMAGITAGKSNKEILEVLFDEPAEKPFQMSQNLIKSIFIALIAITGIEESAGSDINEGLAKSIRLMQGTVAENTADRWTGSQAEEAQELFKQIQDSQNAGTPKYYLSPNTRLANALEEGLIDAGNSLLMVQPAKGKGQQIDIRVNAALVNTDDIKLQGKPYTEYDRAVHDAISSIYEDRAKRGLPAAATADMIYRVMTNKTDTEKVSAQQKGAITKSVEKMRKNIFVKADVTEQMKRRGIVTNPAGKTETDRHRLVFDGFMLSARGFDNMGKGDARISGWIFEQPFLLQYAHMTNELLTAKAEMLNIRAIVDGGKLGAPIANTEDRIAVRSALLRRVEIMRHDEKTAADAYRKNQAKCSKDASAENFPLSHFRKQSRIVLLNELLDKVGVENKNTRTACKEYIQQVLQYWQAIGAITGYKIRKSGKSADAVIIDLQAPN